MRPGVVGTSARRFGPILLLPLIPLAILIGIWVLLASQNSPSILPGPDRVWDAFVTSYQVGAIQPAFVRTLTETLAGWAIASVIGLPIGYALARWLWLERALGPSVAASQAMPIIAIAPLLLIWVSLGIEIKIVLAALIAFFPVVTNTVAGLHSIDGDLRDVARVFGANWWQTIVHVEGPRAARSIMAGERLAVVLALVGAYVGEYINPDQGLGALVLASEQRFSIPLAYAATIIVMVLGATLYIVLTTVERIVIHWTN